MLYSSIPNNMMHLRVSVDDSLGCTTSLAELANEQHNQYSCRDQNQCDYSYCACSHNQLLFLFPVVDTAIVIFVV